jgi:diguanylate cyclase (GGDEF)-like protein
MILSGGSPTAMLAPRVRRNGRDLSDLWRRSGLRRLSRRPFVATFAALGTIELLRLVVDPRPVDLLVLALVALVGLAAVREREAVVDSEGTRRTEAESFARILRALARSVSPDAIVAAIVEELGAATGADHVAVVRRRPDARVLEAILSPTRPGAPTSRTTLPVSELEDPAEDALLASSAIAASRGRRLTAVPIEPDPAADPEMVPLGVMTERLVGAARAPVDRLTYEAPTATMASLSRTTVIVPPVASGVERSPGSWVATAPSGGGSRRITHATPSREGAEQRIANRIALRLRDVYGLRNVIAAPLRVDGKVEGAVVVSRRTAAPWPASARRILEAASVEASAALARVYTLRDAETRASTDALTGLPNRRYFDEYVTVLSRRRRAEDRVGVLMIDIDRFKRLNDTFGHAVGDHVLREVAQAIGSAVREEDVPARFGGEEFAVLLKNPSPEVAVEVGRRVRDAVASLDLHRLGVPGVTVSVGVSVADSPTEPLDELIDAADRALYRAKRGGRDRVVAA